MAGDSALGVRVDTPALEPTIRRVRNHDINALRGKILHNRTNISLNNFHSALETV